MGIPAELVPIVVALGSSGGAAVVAIRQIARYLRYRQLRAKVEREANEPGGPEFGTLGWVYRELRGEVLRERGARHALERELRQALQRLAAAESALRSMSGGSFRPPSPSHPWQESGEQERIPGLGSPGSFDNDTDRDDDRPPWGGSEEVRTAPATPDARARARRSRP